MPPLSRRGTACGVLFLVHWPHARFFLPDYHTDLEFARTFAEVREDLLIKAVSLTWRPDLSLAPEIREVAIPWDTIEREARDSGSYHHPAPPPPGVTAQVGSLGELPFSAGYYLYVGTARRALTKRLERHLRKRTALHWHIDYLKGYADKCTAIPIRSSTPLEHELAEAVGRIADGCVASFGSSDCDCPGHLFRFAENPLRRQSFIDLLLHFRIDRLERVTVLKTAGASRAKIRPSRVGARPSYVHGFGTWELILASKKSRVPPRCLAEEQTISFPPAYHAAGRVVCATGGFNVRTEESRNEKSSPVGTRSPGGISLGGTGRG